MNKGFKTSVVMKDVVLMAFTREKLPCLKAGSVDKEHTCMVDTREAGQTVVAIRHKATESFQEGYPE